MSRRLRASAPSPKLSGTWSDERLLIRLVQRMSRITFGYRVVDSYVRRDPRAFQHTLDGQTAAVRVAGILDLHLCANRRGASVGSAHRCDFLKAYRLGSLDLGGTGYSGSVVLHDTITKNISYSWHVSVAS